MLSFFKAELDEMGSDKAIAPPNSSNSFSLGYSDNRAIISMTIFYFVGGSLDDTRGAI